eukprot:TRINITY_DN9361_c0_g1_i1.p1 TRINITY_DN9361_c0_g1~~TRINITY_DN9361_c0_g1_i1.p1  ORF type:complete len:413 (-),score=121.32 TRINITY_DN9361_c0_g1_i1:111-1349(-)
MCIRDSNKTVSDTTLPAGCSVVTNSDGTATITFNSASSSIPCASSPLRTGQATSDVGVTFKASLQSAKDQPDMMVRSPKGKYCQDNKVNVIKSFLSKSAAASDQLAALTSCETLCLASDTCNFCSADNTGAGVQYSAIPVCGTVLTWAGAIVGDVSSKTPNGQATITLSGPADVWFGVGLNAQNMADAPYTFIVNSSGVTEQQIGTCGSEAEHCPGDTLKSSITLVSNTVANNVRTVVVTRSFKGLSPQHYSFNPSTVTTLNFITAVGSSQVFAYHKAHAVATVSFTTVGLPSCACDTGKDGKMCATDGTGCDSFVKDCLTHTQGGDLFAQDNPTCNSVQYAGGLRCCGHQRIMIDADQPVRPELLRYHMKFRFWFQEYVPANASSSPKGTTQPTTASHLSLIHISEPTRPY